MSVGHMMTKISLSLKKKCFRVASNSTRIKILRSLGMKIGDHCIVNPISYSTEPYLIEIGNHVAIASGTHDGAVWVLREKFPDIDVFGNIKIGDNTFVGADCTILPNTVVGTNCVIGAGSVVRGEIPDNSVVIGNPARVIMKTPVLEKLLLFHKHRVDIKALSPKEKEAVLLRHFGLSPAS